MSPRELFTNLKAIFPTLLLTIVALAGAGAAIWYLPNRTAAVILGVVAAIALVRFVLQGLSRITQIAIFWLSVGVVADAAYAKLNDQAPLTIASLVVKFMEAVVKLLDILIRSIGFGGPNIRASIASVTPDFTWALILTATLLMAVSLAGRQRNGASASRPELRRAA